MTAMAGAVDNEDRVTVAAAMYDNEASAEDYGDQVEDMMGGDSTKTTTITMAMAAATMSNDGSYVDNGGNNNDETTTPTSTAF